MAKEYCARKFNTELPLYRTTGYCKRCTVWGHRVVRKYGVQNAQQAERSATFVTVLVCKTFQQLTPNAAHEMSRSL